mmetsp:Transcript_4068/g.9790  ORF Transcript_4068/g.9790 Transcript_4068/m.9790 type:complete len:295 (+) Transcript_4068:133-1017(+)
MMKRTRTRAISSVCVAATGLLLLSTCGPEGARAFSIAQSGTSTLSCSPFSLASRMSPCSLQMADTDDEEKDEAPAGSFFHKVPPSDDSSPSSDEKDAAADNGNENKNDEVKEEVEATTSSGDEFDNAVSKLMRQRRKKPLASEPSTINGVPTKGFGKPSASSKQTKRKPINPYVAIGTPDQPVNDPTKPERDDQGYTLYTDTQTGEKSRVFEALVDYPSIFTMKIVGANEGSFVPEMVALVAEACETDLVNVKHSTKVMGKWVSVTVKAPVQSAEMLYYLYEKVDMDPRVKFKF